MKHKHRHIQLATDGPADETIRARASLPLLCPGLLAHHVHDANFDFEPALICTLGTRRNLNTVPSKFIAAHAVR
jgi:hypothetical protein